MTSIVDARADATVCTPEMISGTISFARDGPNSRCSGHERAKITIPTGRTDDEKVGSDDRDNLWAKAKKRWVPCCVRRQMSIHYHQNAFPSQTKIFRGCTEYNRLRLL